MKLMDTQNIIEMLHITKEFNGVKANDDITLQLKKGEIHALLGENGAGKSTLDVYKRQPLSRACVVQPGDTLSVLSRRYGTDECVIACANGIRRSDSLYAGQVLRVTDTPLTGSACAFTGHYVVQPGDKAAKIRCV